MGRGTTELMSSLYIPLGGSVVGSNSTRVSAVHDEAAVDAERLPRHVAGAIGGEKSDDGGDVLGPLHAPERHRLGAPARELLRGDAHHRALVARDLGPHVRLDEARAHAV